MSEENKRRVSITRKSSNESNGKTTKQSTNQSGTGGICLASTKESEKDPFKVELDENGYRIISENEYGVIVQKAKGKPTFMARTTNGYLELGKPSTIFLPESINIAMKKCVADKCINAQQYILQLIIKDLRENDFL